MPRVAGRGREADHDEDEALPAGRDDGRRHVRGPEVGDRPHVRDLGISTVSDSRVHHPTAIVVQTCRRPASRPSRPSRGPRRTPEALVHSACRVFQSRRRRLSSSNLASAASRSVSSNSSQRLIRSPSTVRSVDLAPLGVEALLRGPVRRMSDDRSEVAQPMHSLDVDADRRESHAACDVCGQVTGRERDRSSVVDVHPVRRRRGEFAPVERGVARAMTDHVCAWAAASPARYRASSSAKAASMSSGSNDDDRHDPLVGVDLDDAEHLGVERLGPLVAGRVADTTEDEALPAGRDDGRRHIRDPDVGDRSHVRDLGISTVSDPGVHDPTAIVVVDSRRPVSPPSRPSRGPRSTSEALVRSACRVFQPRRRPAELVEPRERGVEVCLVEIFAAADQVAVDRQRSISRHSASKPSCEVPCRRMGDDRAEVAQPMHSLDVDAEVGRRVPMWRGCTRSGHRARTLPPRRWSMFTQSGVVGGSSCRLNAA